MKVFQFTINKYITFSITVLVFPEILFQRIEYQLLWLWVTMIHYKSPGILSMSVSTGSKTKEIG